MSPAHLAGGVSGLCKHLRERTIVVIDPEAGVDRARLALQNGKAVIVCIEAGKCRTETDNVHTSGGKVKASSEGARKVISENLKSSSAEDLCLCAMRVSLIVFFLVVTWHRRCRAFTADKQGPYKRLSRTAPVDGAFSPVVLVERANFNSISEKHERRADYPTRSPQNAVQPQSCREPRLQILDGHSKRTPPTPQALPFQAP